MSRVGSADFEVDVVDVSCVVCARNRAAMIGRCLATLRRARPAEIIVVDGQSTDATASIAAAAGARVMSDAGAGLGAARHIGAEAARCDHVVFVDSDMVVEPDTLRLLLEEAERDRLDAVEARISTLTDRPTYWQCGEEWRRRHQGPPGPASAFGCQATLVRRDLILEIGFDPTFSGAAEDGDFFRRAVRAGARLARSARARAYHDDRAGFVDFARQRFWHGQGLARTLIRHRRRYLASVVEQTASAGGGLRGRLRYLPFMAASSVLLGLGMAVESARLALSPGLRRRLADPGEMTSRSTWRRRGGAPSLPDRTARRPRR